MTIQEVAEYLHCSVMTVRRLLERKELVGMKVGNRWRFKAEDVEAYLETSKTGERVN